MGIIQFLNGLDFLVRKVWIAYQIFVLCKGFQGVLQIQF